MELRRSAPGPRGWPVLGALPELARDPVRFYASMATRYGDVARVRIVRDDTWILSHPDAIEQVLVALRDQMHKDRITRSLSSMLGDGLVTSEDPLWKRQRRLAAPSFQPRQIAVYARAMVAATEEGLARIGDGPRDVHQDLSAITREIVLRTLFGASGGDGEAVAHAIEAWMTGWEAQLNTIERLLPAVVRTPARRSMDTARAEIDRVMAELLAGRRRDPPGDDLLSRLLAARDEDGQPMSDQQLRDEAVTLFLAGHETTALALSYASWLLASHPEAQERVHAEVVAAAGEGPLTSEHRSALGYTEAVVQEALRMYPPAWVIGRTPTEDVGVAGHLVPRGAQILIPVWGVHHDPRWFPEPDRFRPERFLGDEGSGRPRFAYFPFGGGPRVCVGNHFALLEAVLVLGTWVRALRLGPVPDRALELQPAVTLRPRHGVWVEVVRRGT